jgi:hypothetical protein
VRHHLESLAGRDELGDVDYAMDEDFKRSEGMPFDPWYFQKGEPAGQGVYVVEDRAFVEVECSGPVFENTEDVRFRWRGGEWAVPRPDELGDVHFVRVEGVEGAPPVLELVLVRRRSWWEDVGRLFGSAQPRVLQSEARATPIAPG